MKKIGQVTNGRENVACGVTKFDEATGVQVHLQRADLLRQVVMQFSCDPSALLVLRLQKLGRQFLQLQGVKLHHLLTLIKLRNPCSQLLVQLVNSFFRLSAERQVLSHFGKSVLQKSDRPRLIKGDYWEVKSSDRKLIRAFYDGSITMKVAGDNSFLGWGRNDENFLKNPKLNSLAVVEFCLHFSIFCRNAAAILDPRLRTVDLIVGIRNAFFGDSKLYIIPARNHPYDLTTSLNTLLANRRCKSTISCQSILSSVVMDPVSSLSGSLA